MDKKGFPESYDHKALLRFLSDVKAGAPHVTAPVYSHLVYDVVEGETESVDHPDILIVEGVNVLVARPSRQPRDIPFVSDFFDFSIYLDAQEDVLERWYIDRFLSLRQTAFRDPRSYFRKYAELDDAEAVRVAREIWTTINLENLRNNIAPTRPRASLVLTKGADHRIEEVALRKL